MNLASPTLEQLYKQLRSGAKGLRAGTAKRRIAAQQKKAKVRTRFERELLLLLRQFSSPLMLLLLLVVVLSAILGEFSDTLIVLFILLVSGLLSFLQELHAGRAVDKLLQIIEVKHQVIREGREVSVPVQEVVPGDVVVLHAGDMIPADCRIIESNELHVNESPLTGETFPVAKEPGIIPENAPLNMKSNCLWQGTSVVSGTATALVVHMGRETVFGQMAHSLTQVRTTAFEEGLKNFGYFLLRITILLSSFILLTNLYFQKPFFDSLLFSLALAIGMTPELLPAIMTFAMSAGARRMMDRKVIVKRLASIFSLGEVNVLCTDKTGTITEGSVQVHDVVNIAGKSDPQARLFAFLNATFQNGFTNPIDDVISALPLDTQGYEKYDEIPYDFVRKRLSIGVRSAAGKTIITKGALLSVLEVCSSYVAADGTEQPLDEAQGSLLKEKLASYSQEGFRVLGIAYRKTDKEDIVHENEQQMVFMGFILLEDKLKESTAASLDRLEQMGIAVKIITGDNRYAAMHTAKALGLNTATIITGQDLNSMAPEALTVKAVQTDVFAEVEPYQKERIVRALKKSKFRVAYLGDGINDVAALHAADTGITTNNAVDVAKEAADFVLLEKDLAVLADGVTEGRKSFANSMKYIFATTGATFGNMFSVAGASLLLPFLPMLPKQILLTNLISDVPYLAIASDKVDEEQLRHPLRWDIRLIRRFMLVFGLHSSVFDFATFYMLHFYFDLPETPFQTGWFLESVVTELLIVFIIRTPKSIFRSSPGRLLLLTAALALAVTLWLPFSPFAPVLSFAIAHQQQVIVITGIILAYAVTAELLKHWFFRSFRRIGLPGSSRGCGGRCSKLYFRSCGCGGWCR
ncbi:magnesium-translocating P-type ATPase [Botryobacter ruber]|uniref:magnesium-translocating P-type ATPase n=1 Tax=Botryobacter ruber TaxID=2171629 RepID=UPI000E0C3FA4|nr:magnesium-translocating P-type ATPase [Botryobacter ruber]